MNKFIEFIKRIFKKDKKLLNESKIEVEENNSNRKENFVDNIKIDNNLNNILTLQKKLENEIIDERSLSDKQIIELKELYYNQIAKLIDSINDYKLKLNVN